MDTDIIAQDTATKLPVTMNAESGGVEKKKVAAVKTRTDITTAAIGKSGDGSLILKMRKSGNTDGMKRKKSVAPGMHARPLCRNKVATETDLDEP